MLNRPKSLADYIGQKKIKAQLSMELGAGFPRHILLTGNPGTGKTSLAKCLAAEVKATFKELVCNPKWNDDFITNMLMELSIDGYDKQGRPGAGAAKHIIFFDECHALGECTSALLRPMEDGHCYSNGQVNWLPTICFVFGTTNPEKIAPALLSRIALQFNLTSYTDDDLAQIIERSYPDLGAMDIAKRSKGNPRTALAYAESVHIYQGDAERFFALRGIDEEGLDERDRAYLDILKQADRPLSINSLANALRESVDVIKMMEAFLVFKGMVSITPRGRTAMQPMARGIRVA